MKQMKSTKDYTLYLKLVIITRILITGCTKEDYSNDPVIPGGYFSGYFTYYGDNLQ